jgi:hypothetical protein
MRSCIRPSGAACRDRWPVWRCADQAQNQRRGLLSSMAFYCISWPGSDRSFTGAHVRDGLEPRHRQTAHLRADTRRANTGWPRQKGPPRSDNGRRFPAGHLPRSASGQKRTGQCRREVVVGDSWDSEDGRYLKETWDTDDILQRYVDLPKDDYPEGTAGPKFMKPPASS